MAYSIQQLLELAQEYPAACVEMPFGPDCICVRIGPHGPIFANLMPGKASVNLRCEPDQAMIWRSAFPDSVRRGWHCPPSQQPYNNTVDLNATVPDDVLAAMLSHSYDRALKTMTKEKRKQFGL